MMFSPPMGDLSLRRLAAVLLGERIPNVVVLFLRHVQNHLVAVVEVACPSEDEEERHTRSAGRYQL